MRIRVILLSFGLALAGRPALATEVVATVSHICNLPQPFNNGKVVGHDVGWSNATSYQGYYYFFFGDTLVDADGDWQFDRATDKFKAGTYVARAHDNDDPDDCIQLEYKVDGAGEAARLIPQNPNETFVWPAGAVVANDNLYSYYTAHQSIQHSCTGPSGATTCATGPNAGMPCSDNRDCRELTFEGAGLARINVGATASDTTATRIGGYFFSDHGAAAPIVANRSTLCGSAKEVYLFITRRPSEDPYDASRDIYLVRVPIGLIEDPSAYVYFRSAQSISWVPDFSQATPILSTEDYAATFNVQFDTAENRYRAIYSCGFLAVGLCTSKALSTGTDATALFHGWSTPQPLYDCPGTDAFRCYQGFTHVQYGSGATRYVTAAHNWDDEYHVALRKIEFGTYPFASGPLDFVPLPACRLVDTRNDPEPFGPAPAFEPFHTRKFAVGGACGVPTTAAAASLSIVALDPATTGNLVVYPRDAVIPNTSSSSFHWPEFARANNMIVKLAADGSGEIEVQNDSVGDLEDLIIDVTGYFE